MSSSEIIAPMMSLSDIERESAEGLTASMESQTRLYGAIASMVGFSKTQSEHISALERVVEDQRAQLNQQGQQFADTMKTLGHKIRMLEFRVDGHDFDPDEDKEDEELDQHTAIYHERKMSGYFVAEALAQEEKKKQEQEDAAKSKEFFKAAMAEKEAAAAAAAAEADARIKEKEAAALEGISAAMEADAKRRQEWEVEQATLMANIVDSEQNANLSKVDAQAARDEAWEAAKARMALKVTHAGVSAMVNGIVSEFSSAAGGTDPAALSALAAIVVAEEIGGDNVDEHVNETLRAIGAAGVGDLDVLEDAVDKALCHCFGLQFRKRHRSQIVPSDSIAPLAVAPAPVPVPTVASGEGHASIDPGQLSDINAQLENLGERASTLEGNLNAMRDAMKATITSALEQALPQDLAVVLAASRDLVARAERGEFDPVAYEPTAQELAPAPEFFNRPAPVGGPALPFPADDIVHYVDGRLPESVVADIRKELGLTETITSLLVNKADSDDLAKVKTALAELSNSCVTFEALDRFADLGSKVGAGEVTNSSIKMREALISEVKKNVDLNLSMLVKNVADSAAGSKAFAKLEVQRMEDRVNISIQEQASFNTERVHEQNSKLEGMKEDIGEQTKKIDGLMWTEGARAADSDEVLKRDPADEAKRDDQLRREMEMTRAEVSAALREMEYNIQSAGRRAETAQRGVADKATNQRLESVVEETVRLFNASLNNNVHDIKETLQELHKAMNHRPNREEVLGLFSKAAKSGIGGDDYGGMDDLNIGGASISTQCISCGGKRAASPPRARPMSTPANMTQLTWGADQFANGSVDISATHEPVTGGQGESMVFDDNTDAANVQQFHHGSHELARTMVQSAGASRSASRMHASASIGALPVNGAPSVVLDKAFVQKYNEVMQVVQGQAGLRSLQRQTSPMQPKAHPYLKRRDQPPEPLYRRAKLAQSVRDSTKDASLRSAPAMGGGVSIIYDEHDARQGGGGHAQGLLPALNATKQVHRQQQILNMHQRNADAAANNPGDVYPILQETYPSADQLNTPQLNVGPGGGGAIDDLSLGSMGEANRPL